MHAFYWTILGFALDAPRGSVVPDNVTPGSSRRVAWRCLLDSSHVWHVVVHARALRGSGCPFCAGQRATEENSLAENRPDIAAEWHQELNGPLTPAEITLRSQRKAWWKCSASKWHVFEASVEQRTRSEPAGVRGRGSRGCPFCRGMRVPKHDSLSATHPEVALAWDVLANSPNDADGIAATSSRLVSWRCPRDKTRWRARISDVTSGHVGCPRCTDDAISSPAPAPTSARRSKTSRSTTR